MLSKLAIREAKSIDNSAIALNVDPNQEYLTYQQLINMQQKDIMK